MIDTRNSNSANRTSRMRVGVHTACTVQSAELKTTPANNKLVEITIQNPKGEIMNQAIWFPRLDNLKVPEGKSIDEVKKAEVDKFTDAFLAITKELYPVDQAHVSGETLEGFAKNAIAKISSSKTLVDVVVQYGNVNDKGDQYAEFPRWNWISRHQEGVAPSFDLTKLNMNKSGEVTYGPETSSDGLPF